MHDGPAPFEVPNLDDCFNSDREAYGEVFKKLMDYCTTKSWAVSLRERGDIAGALDFERDCERVYNSLPDWAKW